MKSGLRGVFLAAALGLVVAGCGDEESASGLTVKLINTGSVPVVGFYTAAAGSLAESSWMTADWGDNRLPVAALAQWQFVMLPDFPRQDLDCIAAFDPTASVDPLKWNVPANWIADADYLTIHMGREDADNWSDGHQFGLDHYAGEVDVTPP